MNTTQDATTTNTEIIPQRIASDHYQTPSFTEVDKIYNQHFDYDLKRWNCDCPDHEYRKNLNCKHVILLRTFIKREKAQQQPERQHSSSVELVNVLSRISNLEHVQDSVDGALEKQQYMHEIKADQIAILQGKLRGYEHAMAQQTKQIEQLMEVVRTLQTDICRLNERTNNQQRTIEDQAQQIDKLTEIGNLQQKASEQVVRVVIEQPQRPVKQCKAETLPEKPVARRGRKVSPNKVEAIKENGVFSKCLVGGEHTVTIDRYFKPETCTCVKHQDEGAYCIHMQRVDSEFEK